MGKSKKTNYDAFLIYPYSHLEFASQIAEKLEDFRDDKVKKKLDIWFSKWEVIAGDNLRDQLINGLDTSNSAVILLGPKEPSGHFKAEFDKAFRKRDEDKSFSIIPSFLPDTNFDYWREKFPPQGCIDFREGIDKDWELRRLVYAILGESPGRPSKAKKSRVEVENRDLEIEMKMRIKVLDEEKRIIDVEVIKEPERTILKEMVKER